MAVTTELATPVSVGQQKIEIDAVQLDESGELLRTDTIPMNSEEVIINSQRRQENKALTE